MNIQRQLDFQKGKFEQLSESYRQNRRIIHDVKKHYFYIQEQAAFWRPEKLHLHRNPIHRG